jgi:hypothetical protein
MGKSGQLVMFDLTSLVQEKKAMEVTFNGEEIQQVG